MNDDNDINGSKPTARIALMTKELVDGLRGKNQNNRALKQTVIEYLKNEIVSNRFRTTNQGIAISRNGFVLDGGHRLEALAKAGYPPVSMVLVENLDPESQLCVDTHARRTTADLLSLALNRKMTARLVAALTLLYRAKRNKWRGARVSPYDIKEMTTLLGDAIEWANSIERMFRQAAPVIAAILASYEHNDVNRLAEFATQVINGEGLQKRMPSYALREYLTKSATRAASANQRERYEKALYAIAAHLNDEMVDRLANRETPFVSEPVELPIPVGAEPSLLR